MHLCVDHLLYLRTCIISACNEMTCGNKTCFQIRDAETHTYKDIHFVNHWALLQCKGYPKVTM